MASVSVIGCGYLGAVHAAAMAELGHDVVGIEVDRARVDALQNGRAPFHEPGFPAALRSALDSGRLRFTTDPAAAAGSRVHFICVGTPQQKGSHAADLTYVDAAVGALVPHLASGDLVVGKSTVPVGTAERLTAIIKRTVPSAMLAWNPEFLREGHAIQDTISPDRLVYGLPPEPEATAAALLLDEVYRSILDRGTPRITGDLPTAELVKVAANAFLATKISFINAMAEVCEATGADVTVLADAIGHDNRIGRRFLNAGLGFGGGCLPKDIRGFMARADELGVDQALSFLREIDAINLRRRSRMVDLATDLLDGAVTGRRIAILGTSFKPDSDDVRDSPALDVARSLHLLGARITATDPKAIQNSRRLLPDITYAANAEAAAADADLVMVLTEWREFTDLDPDVLGNVVAHRRVLDGRNALDRTAWIASGWSYRALGRR